MKSRDEMDIVWDSIPNDVDILISHGPPKGVLDVTRDIESKKPIHVGSKSLMRQITERIRPTFHAFGHIHDESGHRNYGMVTRGKTKFINCSCCDLACKLLNPGFVVEVEGVKS